MYSSIVKTSDQIIEFAQASMRKDISYIEGLLSDSGEYEIQNDSLETVEVGKQEFIKWYSNKLSQTSIQSIEYDQCLHCQIGARVVLFNAGKFPRQIKDASERSKTGYKIESKDDSITSLKFCFVFLETDNKYEFQCAIDKLSEQFKTTGAKTPTKR
jgi:hypothetical protein